MKKTVWHTAISAAGIAFIFISLSGCIRTLGNFGLTDQGLAQLDIPPVILIPGVKGSKLISTGNPPMILWGASSRNVLFHTFEDLALYPRTLNQGPWNEQRYLEAIDPIGKARPAGIMEEFVIGWQGLALYRYPVYKELIGVFENDPVRLPRGAMIFLFSYDWRLDNRVAAIRLAKKLSNYEIVYLEFQARLALGRQAQNQQLLRHCINGVKKPGPDIPKTCLARWKRLRVTGALDPEGNVRFTLVAHSMGGLVARYFVDGLGYKGRVNKLILLGSPNLGTMGALKAIVDGEFPESLTGTLGLHLFLKEETRKVYLSYGSIFQLLPRYPEAVTDRDGEDLGDRFGLGKKKVTAGAIGKWKRFFLPTSDQLSPYFPDLEGYLLFQLESARCFHAAINGSSLRCPNEEDRIGQIIHYLEGVERAPLNLPSRGQPVEPPVMLFGSYCYETLTEALIDGNELRFRDGNVWSAEQDILAGGDTSGDGRVPVKSLDNPGDERWEDTRFFLCEGHMELIKDRVFQYNLLRAVLRTFSRS